MSRVSRCRVQTIDFYIISDLNIAKIVSANTQSYVIEIQYRIYYRYILPNKLTFMVYRYSYLKYEYKYFYETNSSQTPDFHHHNLEIIPVGSSVFHPVAIGVHCIDREIEKTSIRSSGVR